MAKLHVSREMQALIEQLAQQHDVDFSQGGTHLRLLNEGFMPLSVETIGKNTVAVGHTTTQNGDVMYDPEIVFVTNWQHVLSRSGKIITTWLPVEMTQDFLGIHRFELVVFENEERTKMRCRFQQQRETAQFANQWARNLHAQGWLEHGRRR